MRPRFCTLEGLNKLTVEIVASFSGGNFILAGIILGEEKYTQFGEELVKSYISTYDPTVTHIGPDTFSWVSSELPDNSTDNQAPPANQTEFYNENGYYITGPGYILRPETIESLWYAYRVTGDSKWTDLAWAAFQAIVKTTRTGSAYAEVNDVNVAGGGGFNDLMESFWLAEVLKYFYLLFDTDAKVQFQSDSPNQYVFNTEAHPMKIRGRGHGHKE